MSIKVIARCVFILSVCALVFSAPSMTRASECVFQRTLKRGMVGDDVRLLQRQLIAHSFLAAENETGFFGVKTERAVQQFQKKQGLAASGTPLSTGFGLFGPRTRNALTAQCFHAPRQQIETSTAVPAIHSATIPYSAPTRPWWLDILTVTPGFGGGSPVSVSPLSVSINSAQTLAEGSALQLSSLSATGGTAPYSFHWNFGDGTTSTVASPNHTYADNGTYTVTVTVTDASSISQSATMAVTVTNALPVADAHGAYTGTTGSSVSFIGSATDAGVTDTTTGLSYSWNFGNGATAAVQNPSYTYVSPGTYTITLSVTDKDGGVGTHSTSIVVSGNPVILPGSGWTEATSSPGPVGTPGTFGYTDTTIAHWDVVPHQTFSETFPVGVVAFHNTGIDRVAFAVNGGAWTNVTTSSTNALTGVNEFWAELRAADFADGRIEIRAIAYPRHGVPRLMSTSLFLNANKNGTLPGTIKYVSNAGNDTTGTGTVGSPYATISKAVSAVSTAQSGDVGGATIYMQAGTYAYNAAVENFNRNAATQWLTITAAPGVSTNDVIINSIGSTAGIRTQKVRLKSLTISGPTIPTNSTIGAIVWLDGVTYVGPGRAVANSQPVSGTSVWTGGIYVTGSNISQSANGVIGAKLVRSTHVHDIGSDAFQSSQVIINCTATTIDASGTTFHPDVYQINGGMSNAIIYGLTATSGIAAQGLFADSASPVTDMAVVNATFNNQNPTPTTSYVMQFGAAATNLYIKDSAFTGPAVWRTDQNFVATDVVVENTTFTTSPGAVSGVTYR